MAIAFTDHFNRKGRENVGRELTADKMPGVMVIVSADTGPRMYSTGPTS